MQYNHISPGLAAKPIRLRPEEVENPGLALQTLFESYDLNMIRTALSDWLELAFGSTDEDLHNGNRRVNLLQFARHMEVMAEAAWLIYNRDGSPGP